MLRWLHSCWPFGKYRYKRYVPLDTSSLCPERWKTEIEIAQPPGVFVGDILQSKDSEASLRQAYLLAVQLNNITDYLKRFDEANVPESCKSVVNTQITKLKSVRDIIWNTMLSMAVGGVTIDDAALKTLLEKRAGESIALIEMEKLATAIVMDDSKSWAKEINNIILSAEHEKQGSLDSDLSPIQSQPLPSPKTTKQLVSI
ncbi:orf 55 [Ateline gammaherpesvirus 3]|uniref:Orf 55 n=1 Tax=Ateline herpesvirus 3 TaxID=85618 RepID=Q9YTL1_ATHV3|nr:orf 55 [Ateline gammaherpesvirus 3]AAC95580.1 orf 55 [Ateline gammaherpesvirus 3]